MKKLKLIKGLAIALAASIFMTGTPVNAQLLNKPAASPMNRVKENI